jgi:hypothetical protein
MDIQLYDCSKKIYSPDKNTDLIFDFENMLYAEGISNASVFRYGEKLSLENLFKSLCYLQSDGSLRRSHYHR